MNFKDLNAEMEALIKKEADGSKDLLREFDRNYVLENDLQTQALSITESNAGNAGVDGRRVNQRALEGRSQQQSYSCSER